MADRGRKKLRMATIVYWVLLLYVITALAWWSVMLLQQAEEIYQLKKENLTLSRPTLAEANYQLQVQKLEEQRKLDLYKVAGEGGTFLILILVGAVFIYRSVRRQFLLHRQQQNFVMAVSHELKTPIAVSRLNLETMQKYQLDDEKRRKLLHMTLQENLRLDTLINNILISAQLEESNFKVEKQEVNLSLLVQEMGAQFQQRYPTRALDMHIQEGISVQGDERLLRLMLSNLLENANKYSPKESPVGVRLKNRAAIILEVTDEGPGIPEAEKKNVFKKFYRMGNEDTRKSQGTGLGLFIVKRVVQDHGGTVTIKNNSPQGSKFIIQL